MTSPSAAVALELARALTDLALLPLRTARYALTRRSVEAAVRADLAAEVDPPAEPEASLVLPGRPLRVFLSCAEPSGQLHGLNLVHELRRLASEVGAPEPEISALGGPALAAEGVTIVGDPVSRAAMGFDVLGSLPFYLGLLRDAAAHLGEARPDVFLPVDSPALHVPLARIARGRGVPTVHFVTPQYWGWAPWRVNAYRRAVDLALCILPFEVPWFERHGVPTRFVGHPLLDELAEVEANHDDVDEPVLAVLPGSRGHVVRRNLPWMLDVVADARRSGRLQDVRLVVPCSESRLEETIHGELAAWRERAADAPEVEVVTDDLHGVLRRARAAFSVSGTVLLDLLHHRLPAIVVYRLSGARQSWAYRHLLTVPWFASTNLLADEEVLPELCFHGEGPRSEAAAAVARALEDEAWRAHCRAGLERAAGRLGGPGAVRRAADAALRVAGQNGSPPR